MSNTHLLPWLAAIRLPTIGPITIRRWLEYYGDLKTLFSASAENLRQFGFRETQVAFIQSTNWREIEREAEWCKTHSAEIISLENPRYPKLLYDIPDAPLLLFAQGNMDLLSEPQLAIVGTRNPTPIGQTLAYEFAEHLSQTGLTITSGLALGIDTESHKGALHANGNTIAVFGTGLNTIYPASNRKLAEKIIASKGLLITEFPPFEMPKAKNFPRRNRIISGLSLGVLVVEAAIRSGSLITARMAAEQGREVFAIPGSIHNPMAHGCHHLIRQGAKLVEKATDIIEELGPLAAFSETHASIQSKPNTSIDTKTQKILHLVGYEITPIDAIILRSGLTADEVSSMLLTLELHELIKYVTGGYIRVGHLDPYASI